MGAFYTKEEIESKQVAKEISTIMKKPEYKTVPISIVKKTDGKNKKRKKTSPFESKKRKKSKNY